ncbi:hypothetical protein EJ07DRAFT_152864 [Lizonia empirigonia]|nr:hypothetical protein EJ07DRAFT_152864 [Lizonia empirigonia]
MKILYAACAITAPALAAAAAFAMPDPTHHFAPAANKWSPAPTAAPQFNLFGRDVQPATDNTCGYVSGLSASSVTCPNPTDICATNTFFGVHGCCKPSALSSCTIATTCIPSAAMSASCTDAACTADAAIAKCTLGAATECYKWLFAYPSTTLTQHGCTASGFTSTALRTYGSSTTPPSAVVVTVTASFTPSPTPTSPPNTPSRKQSLGPIVGGTVGGCTIISLVALAAFLVHRRRSSTCSPTSTSPPLPATRHTHPSPRFHTDAKPWPADARIWHAAPGMGPSVRVAEVHGQDRAVEVEAGGLGWWGGRAVEVDASGEVGAVGGAVEKPV